MNLIPAVRVSSPRPLGSLDEASLILVNHRPQTNHLVYSKPIALSNSTFTPLLQLPFKSLRYYNFNTITPLLTLL
jgi:hypothetical protein